MEYVIVCVEKWIHVSIALFVAYTIVDAAFAVYFACKGKDISCHLNKTPSNLAAALLWPFGLITALVFVAICGIAAVVASLFVIFFKVKGLVYGK